MATKLKSKQLAFRKEVAAEIRQARLDAGISQVELAKRAKTKSSSICRMESGTESIRLDTLVKLADAMGYRLVISIE